ncbi:hypothetical protein DFP73DRAFT_599836 [Morchella snyderi]|nr:hypothetical protein DFP73DRAFT_599836 [Morchella snyderi]
MERRERVFCSGSARRKHTALAAPDASTRLWERRERAFRSGGAGHEHTALAAHSALAALSLYSGVARRKHSALAASGMIAMLRHPQARAFCPGGDWRSWRPGALRGKTRCVGVRQLQQAISGAPREVSSPPEALAICSGVVGELQEQS